MKAKTKLQHKAVELSSRLKGITKEQKSWFFKRLAYYAVRSRKTVYCLECGHKWQDPAVMVTTILGCTCPVCKTDLKMLTPYRPPHRYCDYGAILTTVDSVQVIRFFFLTKIFSKRKKAEFFCEEVMQHFIWPDGKGEELSKTCNNMLSYNYIDAWSGGNLEIRTNSDNQIQRISIVPSLIYPKRDVLHIIRRNGFSRYFYNISPRKFFNRILTDNRFETLLKVRQIKLFQHFCTKSRDISEYWPLIRICIRHGYIIDDPSMWFDYIGFLKYFKMDVRNPSFLCPDNLMQEHDALMTKKAAIVAAIMKEKARQRAIDNEEEYARKKASFFDLVIRNKNILIRPLHSVNEFVEEEAIHKHCVYSSDYYADDDSLILRALVDGVPTETVEFSLSSLKVVQARGKSNKPSKHNKEVVSLVNRNRGIISKCINS